MIFVNYPGHLAAGLLLIATAGATAFAFRSKELQSSKQWKWSLGLLQYVSIVTLLLILWNPSRPRQSKILSRNSVLVLFDTSQSMSLVEDGRMTRLEKAINVFLEKFDPSDHRGPEYRAYGFDSRCRPAIDLGLSSPDSTIERRRSVFGNFQWGLRTELHKVFALLDRYERAESRNELHPKGPPKEANVAGVVVFTDGQADDKNVNKYAPVPNKDLQVVLIGVGSKVPQSDVAVQEIKAPSRIAIDTAYPVQILVTARNLGKQSVTVELLKDDQVIAYRQLPHDAFARGVTADFTVSADRLGSHILLARARAGAEEINLTNNVRTAVVHVVEETALKVLFYSQVANFDIGKVRQALARDKAVRLDLGLDAIIAPALSRKVRMMCGHVKLPAERADFYRYDVVILGSCDVDKLTNTQIDGLYSFVVDRGGGLIVLPGRDRYGPAAWKNKTIKALLPLFLEVDAGVGQPPDAGEIKLTLEGINTNILSPADLEDYDEPTSPRYRVIDKKPAAATLVQVHGTPIVSVHRVGRGRVCLVNTSQLFRLYREDLQGGLLRKFMSGLTAYVGRVPNVEAAVELFAERPIDQMDKVRFDAYVCDQWFAPVAGATVLLSVGDELLRMYPVGEGYYAAEVENISGEAIMATVQAEVEGRFLGEKTIAVNLPPVRSEMDNVELDERFLRALARRIGGKYLDADDVDESIAKTFKAATSVGSLTRMASVWPKWYLLLALCLLLSINWFVRRAIGLV